MAVQMVFAVSSFCEPEYPVNGHAALEKKKPHEKQIVIPIPDFSDPKYSANGCAALETKPCAWLEWLGVAIFLNGNTPDNEGHVSIVLSVDATYCTDVACLSCTVSVVDANGKSLCPQSVGMKGEGDGSLSAGDSAELGKFIRRCAVLDPEKELLNEDTLILQFDLIWDDLMPHGYDNLPQDLRMDIRMENLESDYGHWSGIYKFDPDLRTYPLYGKLKQQQGIDHPTLLLLKDGYPPIFSHSFVYHLRDDISPLCDRLRQKSQYYESLFRKVVVDENRFSLYLHEWMGPSTDLILFLKNKNLEHVLSVDKCIALYYLTHKYGILHLKEICSKRLEFLMSSENAVEILEVAELCKDIRLCTHVSVHILLNLKQVKISKEWKVLCKNCPVSTKRIARLANEIEVRNLSVDAGLRSTSLQYVLMNWDEVQLYSGCDASTIRFIESCLKKDFDCEFPNLNEIGPVEKYKQRRDYYDSYIN